MRSLVVSLLLVGVAHAAGRSHATGPTEGSLSSIRLTGQVNSDGEMEYLTEGLPGLSRDGQHISVVDRSGAAACTESALRIFSARTGKSEELLPLVRCPAMDEAASMEAATTRQVDKANKLLATGRYAGLTKLAVRFSPDEAPPSSGASAVSAYDPGSGELTLGKGSGLKQTWIGRVSKLVLDCGPNGKSRVYPTHIDTWTDRQQAVLVLRLLAIGPQDWCSDPQEWRVVPLSRGLGS